MRNSVSCYIFFVFDSFAFCSRLLYTCSSWFATFLNKCRFAWIKLVGPFLTDAWMIMQCWWFCLFSTHSTFIVCMWRIHRIKWEWSLSHYRHHCNALLACLYWYVYGTARSAPKQSIMRSSVVHLSNIWFVYVLWIFSIFFHIFSGISFDVESEKMDFYINWSNPIFFSYKRKTIRKIHFAKKKYVNTA